MRQHDKIFEVFLSNLVMVSRNYSIIWKLISKQKYGQYTLDMLECETKKCLIKTSRGIAK